MRHLAKQPLLLVGWEGQCTGKQLLKPLLHNTRQRACANLAGEGAEEDEPGGDAVRGRRRRQRPHAKRQEEVLPQHLRARAAEG